MASFLNKAKEKIEQTLNSNDNKGNNPRSDNYGSHGSNVANQADPRIDSDRDGRNDPSSRVGGYGQNQAYDQHNTTGGAGGFASSDTYGSNTNNPSYDNPQSTNAGPHKSNLLNKLDPRADSDRDHRNDPTSRVGGHGNTQHHGDGYGTAGGAGGLGTSDTGYGGSGASGYGTTPIHNATTHEGHGHTGTTGHSGHTGGLAAATTTGTSGYGTGSTNNPSYDNPQSTTAGPHSSNLLNKADPRVDSDRDHRNDPTSRVGGYGTQGEDYSRTSGTTGGYSSGNTGGYSSGTTGGYGADTTTGGYSSGTTGGYSSGTTGYGADNTTGGYGADSTTGGYGGTHSGTHTGSHTGAHTGSHTGTYGGNTGGVGTNTGGYGDDYNNTPGSGNAPGTAGPHNSNILNKLDPRVDSDLDGSKTYGGNQTHR